MTTTVAAPERACPVTGEPLPCDRYLSRDGARRLAQAAAAVPALMDAIDVAKSGWRRDGGTHVATVPTSRPPLRLDVLDAASAHERTLLKWGAWVAHEDGATAPQTWPGVAAALSRATTMAGRPWAGTLASQVIAATRALQVIAEPPTEQAFYGRCLADTGADVGPCDVPIYAPPGTAWARCPACGTLWDLPDLLAQHLHAADDWTVTPAEASRLITAAGHPLAASTIRVWAHRGHITPDADGRYHLRDILTHLTGAP